MTRCKAIRKRWTTVLITALSGAGCVVLGGPLLLPIFRSWFGALGTWAALPAVVLFFLVCLYVARGRWLGWLGVRYLWSYPPTWLAGALGCAFLLLFWSFCPAALAFVDPDADIDTLSAWYSGWWMQAAGVVLLVFVLGTLCWLILFCRRWWRATRSKPATQQGPKARTLAEPEQFRKWIKDDREIGTPDEDRLGYDAIAKRIASTLINGIKNGQAPTLALVGPLGSGKSSICNLVKHHLEASRDPISFVPVSLWGFDTTAARLRGILDALTRELGRHVNIARVTGIPGDYLRVIESVAPRYAPMMTILRGAASQEDVLRAYEEIAVAIDLHVVLVIEDLERFAEAENDVSLGPIRAMLHLFDRLDNVSVVIASTSLQARFDLDKIARFIERPPELAATSVWSEITKLRKACLDELATENLLDPVTPTSRQDLEPGRTTNSLWMLGSCSPVGRDGAWLELAKTPRQLKSALRSFLETWDALKGEVDIDDVLLMSFVRVAEPDVFALIDKHSGELQRGLESIVPKEDQSDFERELDIIIPDKDSHRRKAIAAIVNFVFPDHKKKTLDYSLPGRPQGLGVDRHVDYWRRYLSGQAIPDGEKDQPVLRAIQEWKNGEKEALVRLLENETQSKALVTFGDQFSDDDVLELLKVTASLPWPIGETAQGQVSPSVASARRLCFYRNPDSQQLTQVLIDLIRIHGKSNPALARYLADSFDNVGTLKPNILKSDQIAAVKTALSEFSTAPAAKTLGET